MTTRGGDIADLRERFMCPTCGAQFSRLSAASRKGARVLRARMRCHMGHVWEAHRQRDGGTWDVGIVTARKPGRPKGRTAPPTAVLGLRITTEQRAALDAAVPTGWTLAEWARETLLRAAGRADLTEAARLAAPGTPHA